MSPLPDHRVEVRADRMPAAMLSLPFSLPLPQTYAA
jgi:hypothetical protein